MMTNNKLTPEVEKRLKNACLENSKNNMPGYRSPCYQGIKQHLANELALQREEFQQKIGKISKVLPPLKFREEVLTLLKEGRDGV